MISHVGVWNAARVKLFELLIRARIPMLQWEYAQRRALVSLGIVLCSFDWHLDYQMKMSLVEY